MTTKTLDSTVSEILQDNPTVEYVSPEENSIATVQTDVKNLTSANPLFDFHATHNGEACIESLDPKDRGTERQFRFTIGSSTITKRKRKGDSDGLTRIA